MILCWRRERKPSQSCALRQLRSYLRMPNFSREIRFGSASAPASAAHRPRQQLLQASFLSKFPERLRIRPVGEV